MSIQYPRKRAGQAEAKTAAPAPQTARVEFTTMTVRRPLFEVAPGVEVLPPKEVEEAVARWVDAMITELFLGRPTAEVQRRMEELGIEIPGQQPTIPYQPLHLPVDPTARQRDARQAQERMLEEMRGSRLGRTQGEA